MRHLRKHSAVRMFALVFSAQLSFTTISAHLTDILDHDIRNDEKMLCYNKFVFIVNNKRKKRLLRDSDKRCN